jgi:bacterioferritin (cytochrome b1)
MPSLSERELWLLNLYRNSELRGALLMGRLAKRSGESEVLAGATRHCATEAQHAALLSELISKLGGTVNPLGETIQDHYAKEGGIPKELVELLVLSEVLERRVLLSYREHLQRQDVCLEVRRVLQDIIRDEEEHSGKEGWAELYLADRPSAQVEKAREKWNKVDQKVASDLHRFLEETFRARGVNQ